MEFSAESIINRIKTLCEIKDLEVIEISPQIVSKWKLRNSIPRADDLFRIAKYLNVSMEWLLTGENPTTNLPLDIQKVAHELLTVEGKKRDSIISLIHNQVEFWKNN